ncbi:MAG: glutathione-disulfide reductase [Micropepsaceae bacterium]
MSSFDFDLLTIGAGSGGVRATRMAAVHGARAAVVEEYRVGGTCVIRGCVPKKIMVYASRYSEDFEDAAGFGWTVGHRQFDWATLIANKDREIARLEGLYKKNLAGAGATLFEDRAVVLDQHTVQLVKSGTRVTARTLLIATGGHPFVPPEIQGRELAITSNEAFHLKSQPKSVVVVGGGYIAIEFAGIFNGLGTKTHLVHHGEEVLRGFDREIRERMRHEMQKRGIDVHLKSSVVSIRAEGGRKRVRLSDHSEMVVDEVMFAVGRRPNVQGLGLETCGVQMDAAGAVRVDAHSRSSVDNIYAIGDVTNRVNLTPIAIREGAAFAETVFNNAPTAVDHADIPTAVFGTPEIGVVGLTEEAARVLCSSVDIYKTAFRPMRATMSGRDTLIFMKLVVDGESQRVLGCHVIGEAAAEMIQCVAIAVKMKATKQDFDATVALHPSAAEELVLLKTKS